MYQFGRVTAFLSSAQSHFALCIVHTSITTG